MCALHAPGRPEKQCGNSPEFQQQVPVCRSWSGVRWIHLAVMCVSSRCGRPVRGECIACWL
ncbi:unnamed protein product, partial [Choristocarpus tenellus]